MFHEMTLKLYSRNALKEKFHSVSFPLSIPLRRLLCNAMMKPSFDYVYYTWYPNINKNFRVRLQAAQNKCTRFCQKLGDRKSITVKEFEKVNWMSINASLNQSIPSCIYKVHAKKATAYMYEIFSHSECNGIPAHYSYQN